MSKDSLSPPKTPTILSPLKAQRRVSEVSAEEAALRAERGKKRLEITRRIHASPGRESRGIAGVTDSSKLIAHTNAVVEPHEML